MLLAAAAVLLAAVMGAIGFFELVLYGGPLLFLTGLAADRLDRRARGRAPRPAGEAARARHGRAPLSRRLAAYPTAGLRFC
jgi:hypothetical protein